MITKHFRLYHDRLGYWQVQYQPMNTNSWFTKATFNELSDAQEYLITQIQRLPSGFVASVDDTLDITDRDLFTQNPYDRK